MPVAIRAVVRQLGRGRAASARSTAWGQGADRRARRARRRGRGGGRGVRGRVARNVRNVWNGRGRQHNRCRGNIRTRRVTAVVPWAPRRRQSLLCGLLSLLLKRRLTLC